MSPEPHSHLTIEGLAAMAEYARHFLPTPTGFVACRVIVPGATLTHLVALDEQGSNGSRPTVCGLTRFDARDENGQAIPNSADLPGWGMGDSGVRGPDIDQITCDACYREVCAEQNDSTARGSQP